MVATQRPGGLMLTEKGLCACRFAPGARVLDVGCGAGATVHHLRERHRLDAFGLDISAAGRRYDAVRVPDPFVTGKAEELPLVENCCDGIICECVLSLVQRPERALAEFARVLRRDGFLIVSDLYLRAGCSSGIKSMEEIVSLLEEAGFELSLQEDHTFLLREMAAQLLLNGSSLDCCPGFERGAAPGGDFAAGNAALTLGYYLVTARKR